MYNFNLAKLNVNGFHNLRVNQAGEFLSEMDLPCSICGADVDNRCNPNFPARNHNEAKTDVEHVMIAVDDYNYQFSEQDMSGQSNWTQTILAAAEETLNNVFLYLTDYAAYFQMDKDRHFNDVGASSVILDMSEEYEINNPGFELKLNDIHNMKPGLWYVNAYSINQVFGGYEEGGWYYTEGGIVKDPMFYKNVGIMPSVHLTREEANKAEDIMENMLKAKGLDGRYGYQARKFEYEPLELFPKVRPYYC